MLKQIHHFIMKIPIILPIYDCMTGLYPKLIGLSGIIKIFKDCVMKIE